MEILSEVYVSSLPQHVSHGMRGVFLLVISFFCTEKGKFVETFLSLDLMLGQII